jgi:hypothetical protein
VQLAAPGSLADLGALVLGDHPLELAQQLVLGRRAALGLLGEDDLDAGAGELLEQQHLVGVAAREPIGRVAQQHLEAALGDTVAQPLERRPGERRAGEAVLEEHQLVGDDQAALGGQLTQPGDLAVDRLLLALALRGHPRVDRRHPRRLPGGLSHRSAPFPLARPRRPHAGAPAPAARTPAPAWRPPAGRRRTRSQPALPPRAPHRFRGSPRSSPTRSASAAVALRLHPLPAAAARNRAISDAGSLTVNTAVRSGTATPSGESSAARTYRRACRSETPCST